MPNNRHSARVQTLLRPLDFPRRQSITKLSQNSNESPTDPKVPQIDNLLTVEPKDFDVDKFVEGKCILLGEKALRELHVELKEHSRMSLQEMRKSVQANYKAFIRTSEEITKLENYITEMKHHLTVQGTSVKSLVELSQEGSSGPPGDDHLPDRESAWEEDPEPCPAHQIAREIPEEVEYLLVERRMEEAIDLLEEGEELVQRSVSERGDPEDWLDERAAVTLHRQLAKWRDRLEGQLAELAKQPTARRDELLSAVACLHRLGNGQLAHTLLLGAHGARLRLQARELRQSGVPFSGSFTASLAQAVFSGVLQAAEDSSAIWRDSPEQASELVLWAQQQAQWLAVQLNGTVLSACGAQGGLRLAAECATIAVAHCALLEEHGLSLVPVLTRAVRPTLEEALEWHFFRVQENVEAQMELDSWLLSPLREDQEDLGLGLGLGVGSETSHLQLSASAHMLHASLQELVEDVAPVITLQLMGPVLLRIADLFEKYVRLLLKALPEAESDGASEADEVASRASEVGPVLVNKALEESQQLALLGNASALADVLLPRLAARLATPPDSLEEGGNRRQSDLEILRYVRNHNEQREWYVRLQGSVERLRDVLCSALVAEFMFGEDGQPLLTPQEYLQLDARLAPHEWREAAPLPSPPFQALFVALTSMACSACELLPHRDKVVTLLLMRLAEWLLVALMRYSRFWEDLEGAEWALGPCGLQQLVLDMYFVMQLAANGRFSSRALRKLALDSMARAITLYQEQSGGDPNRVLEDDGWFQARCQEAMDELLARNPDFRLHQGSSSVASEDLYS